MADAKPDLTLLYEQNASVLAIFLEWRHKVMTYWFAIVGAVFAAAGWLYQQPAGRSWTALPLALGALFSALSALLDRRNVQILQGCYRLGGEIETKLFGRSGIYQFIGDTHEGGITYTQALRICYWGVAALLGLFAVLSAAFIRSPAAG
jgi:hypothetical protein